MKLKIPDLGWKGWLAVGAGAALLLFRKQAVVIGGEIVDEVKKDIFRIVIPSAAQPYADTILQVASEQAVDPLLIVALGEQETGWTMKAPYTPRGDPHGTGDSGHGHGIMQIDDRTWASWLAANDWGDPYTNITKGVQILKQNLAYFAGKGLTGQDQLKAALAAYNHGPGNVWKNIQAGGMAAVDNGTSLTKGVGYGASVLGIFANLTSDFQTESSDQAQADAVSGWGDGHGGKLA